MDLIDQLIDFFKKPEVETREQTPDGLCPVCWGYQQYDGKFRILFKDKQIDINNHKQIRSEFEEIIKKYVDGITLKKGEIIECPECNS